jgi:predicted nuclease of predicted toxin-antitoxin system
MSRLFIELYLDEDTDVRIADLVRSRGFKVTTAQEAGQIGKEDDEQLAYALSQRSALLTHNRVHFEALAREYFTAGKKHHGIIIAVRRPTHEIVRRLLLLLNHITADEMENQIRYI